MATHGTRRSFLHALAALPALLAGCAGRGPAGAPAPSCPPPPPSPGPRVEADLAFGRLRDLPLAREVEPAFALRLHGTRRRR
jgi:hypothetical protein